MKVKTPGGWKLVSKKKRRGKRRVLGRFSNLHDLEVRERQINYFKHVKRQGRT